MLDDSGVKIFTRDCEAIVLRNASRDYYTKKVIFEILILSSEDLKPLEDIVRLSFSNELKSLSWKESESIADLNKAATGLSANGKLLADTLIRNAARDLYDDTFRTEVKRRSAEAAIQGKDITEHHRRCLKQGLWLESLISDVFQKYCSGVWTGQFFGPLEVDVVGTLADHIILVECKDTSYGLNSLYITAEKANKVAADTVIVVTTHDLHANVRKQLPEVKSSRICDCEMLEVISEQSANSIDKAVSAILEKMAEAYISRWMRWDIPQAFKHLGF